MKAGFLIDMDGVIYRENQLIPGAVQFIDTLHAQGLPFLFLTNNSAPTPEDLAVRLKHLGMENISPRNFYTSALNTADFLSETHPNCTVFVLGEGGLTSALHERKIANDAINPSYVVVGEGAISSDKLTKAHEHIERGARLISTNPDNWCPVSRDKTRPGAGATTSCLEASTGQHAYYLGKPNGYMFQRARRKLTDNSRMNPEQIVMVGDTMETDIRGAFEAGLCSFLVLTGSTRLEDVGNYAYQPTRVLHSVADLAVELAWGVPSSRLDSPALSVVKERERRSGSRHQTDFATPRRLRPRPAMVS